MKMGGGCCNTCMFEFDNVDDKKLHYKSEWHRYNLKLNIDGLQVVEEDDFLATQSALAEEANKLGKSRMLYTCALCNKSYRSPKAYENHITSKTHVIQASRQQNPQAQAENAIVRPLMCHKETVWEEVDVVQDMLDEAAHSLTSLNIDDGKQMVAVNGDAENSVEFGSGGFELILKRKTEDGLSAKTLGCRQFSRYYKQHPRLVYANTRPTKLDLASRVETKGLSTMQAKKVPALKMKMWKSERRFGKDMNRLIYTIYTGEFLNVHFP